VDVVRETALDFDDEWVTRVVTAAVMSAGRRTRTALTLLFADDDHLRHLNLTFRGIDKATDVLSFEAGGPTPDGAYVGDVAISVPRALEQGDRHGHGAAREVGYLLVHGVLHLLGFDHEVDADQATMRLVEEVALARVRLRRSLATETITR
jgi:rRNA maturation RNase YbeY